MTGVLICLAAMLVLQIATPYWWWVMVVPFAFGAASQGPRRRAVWTGAVSAGALWTAGAVFFLLTGSRVITARMAVMLKLGSPWLLIAIGGLVAAVAAAVSAWAGHEVRILLTGGRDAAARTKLT